ncbi:unnamed protein product [Protopolystoma xenopodis]|uniref:Nucleoside phosphorylase domain-containing protein n=1 Tax=Protopolystoma xenopodis TaxID=117903 RepID=A0A448WB63_9PLAT|nr:unnamed protein product [Protopolystoma xenopodis]
MRNAHTRGIRNIEMESLCFAAMCLRLGVRAAMISVTLADRLQTDQILAEPDIVNDWHTRPINLLTTYLCHKLGGIVGET